jgi:glycosyltransferase involved in cell wall biosynthesis
MIVAGIPAYNEEKTIARVILLAQRSADVVVVCDDGSQDLTAEIAQKLGAIVIRHEKNMGYGAAIQALFEKAKALNADLLLTLDADGQHDAMEMPNLLKPILENKADIVIGSRFLRQDSDMPFYRRFGVKVLTKFTNGSGGQDSITDGQCGFRAYSRQAIENLTLYGKGMGISAEILLRARSNGLKVLEIPVQAHYKNLETSTHNFLIHGLSVIMTIIRVIAEERPLVFLGIPSLASILIGVLFGLWTLQMYAAGQGIVISIALATATFLLIGFFTLFTAITLYAIVRVSEREKARK